MPAEVQPVSFEIDMYHSARIASACPQLPFSSSNYSLSLSLSSRQLIRHDSIIFKTISETDLLVSSQPSLSVATEVNDLFTFLATFSEVLFRVPLPFNKLHNNTHLSYLATMELDARPQDSWSTSDNNAHEWSKEDVDRWGLEELQRWGREELIRWDEQQAIKKEIEDLTVRLNDAYRRLEKHISKTAETHRPSSTDSGISMEDLAKPPYMRPTTSTKGKTSATARLNLVESPSSSAAPGATQSIKSRFRPRENHIRDSSIMSDTQASQRRTLPLTGRPYLRHGAQPPTPPDSDDRWDNPILRARRIRADRLNTTRRPKSPACTTCKAHIENGQVPLCAKCYADAAAVPALVVKTRLLARPQFESPELQGPIPFHIQMQYKRRSEDLGKLVVWLGLRSHYPLFQQKKFPEGPEAIRFGREDMLKDGFGDEQNPDGCNEMCGRMRGEVFSAMLGMIGLRNSIAHASRTTVHELDVLIGNAQRLAVVLCNEEIAMELRAMRDEVQELSKASWAEMVRMQQLAAQGKEVKWKVHQQRFFLRWRGSESELVDPIAQAASDWNRGHDAVSEDEHFIARVEEVKKGIYWKHIADDGEDVGLVSYADVIDDAVDEEKIQPSVNEFGERGSEDRLKEGGQADTVMPVAEWEAKEARFWYGERREHPSLGNDELSETGSRD